MNRRGIDTAATKQAIRLAERGDYVGMFPEGRINLEPEKNLLISGRPGAAMVALKARVPVIPCYIKGAPYNGTALGSFLMPAKVHVTIGQPIDLSPWYDRYDDRSVQEELTKRFMREIAALAGVTDFEPELAGRQWKHTNEDAAEQPVDG